MPQSMIKRKIKECIIEKDQADWAQKAPRHSKLVINNSSNIIKDMKNLETNRADYRMAVHLITGKAGTNYTLNMMGLEQSKTCPKCEDEEETVAHFLGQCPAYAMIRGEILGDTFMSMTEIFRSIRLKTIIRYAHKTKRLEFDPTAFRDNAVT